MSEYIEREKLIEHLRKDPLFELVERYGITGVIESIPAADVRPVKRGRWEEDCAGAAICPVCNEYAFETSTHHLCGWFPNFCPNCGAWMGDRENEKA